MSSSSALFEYKSSDRAASEDVLYLERLDTFMEKSLTDIKAFAERELRPYEETRRCIAQWHAKYLFQPSLSSSSSSSTTKIAPDRRSQVRHVLCGTSHILESLFETSGVESFLLAVDPTDTSDGGFLGGSLVGREFWRGLRGGGETGARAFKTHCIGLLQSRPTSRNVLRDQKSSSTPPPNPLKGGSRSVKNELYESVRNALRLASGVRSAEMKWTNPERLDDVYGVRLVGWPEGIPSQNPSTLKVSQNKLLLEAIQNGTMRFERLAMSDPIASKLDNEEVADGPSRTDGDDGREDFSWAYDADARPPSPPPAAAVAGPRPTIVASSSSRNQALNIDPPPLPPASIGEMNTDVSSWPLDPVLDADPALSHYGTFTWGEEFSERTIDHLGEDWVDDEMQLERPRKRPRSEEPPSSMNS